MSTSLLLVVLYALCVTAATAIQNVSFIGQEPFTSYISSGAVKDSHVYQLMATSIHGGSISYSIQSDDVQDLSYFKMSPENAIQLAKAPLPQQSVFNLLIVASQSSESVSANLTINVLPTSETDPIFEHEIYSVNITENGVINEFVAFTQAFSLSVTTVKSYLIVDGNTDGAFIINGSTGVVSTSKSLNREAVSHYKLSVSYIDESSSAYTIVNVAVNDENDNSPVFSQSLYIFEVNESLSSSLTIGRIAASDLDIGDNGHITFTIVDEAYKHVFFVNDNGDVIANMSLDYEEVQQYMFQVAATDSGEIMKSAVTTVFVKIRNTDDECPIFSNSNSVYVKDIPYNPLDPPSVGVILTISATDPDNLGMVSYHILSGNEMNFFSINSTNGNISLLKSDDSITGQYLVSVSANDLTCFNTSIAQVEIAIGNSNKNTPKFTSESCSAVLLENPMIGTSVTVLHAIDGDVGTFGQITYEIVQNVGDFQLFVVDPQTGNLTTTGQPGKYDREKKSSLSLGVTATDGGFYQDFCILSITLIDVNDNYPSFDGEEYEITITSNVEYVLEIEAHDPDFGSNGVVSYSLQAAQGTMASSCPFVIDNNSGIITVSNGSSINEDMCIMIVTASDGGDPPLHSTVFVNISIVNNQQIPVFGMNIYSVNITENVSPLVPVVTVKAETESENSDNTIVYTIKKGTEYRTNSNNTFSIQSTGIIEANSQSLPDYESLYPGPYSFRLLVTAKASASGASSLAIVEINVADENDNSPVFVGNNEAVITLTVVEERMKGIVGVIKATDADIGSYGIIEYDYVPTGTSIGQDVFTIHPNGTVELLVNNLDAENPNTLPSYEFFIIATNPFPPNNTRTGTVHLEILIQDINDSPPSFENSTYYKALLESHPLTIVLDVSATDPDTTSSLNYNIVSGNEGATFQIDSDNGELKLKRALDYESIQQYTMIVEVSDGVFQETANVILTVLDIDDEAPVFIDSLYSAVVVENAPIGTSLLTVTATDVDTDMITYEVKGQAVNRFTIDMNGIIRVGGVIDREEFLPTAQIVFLVFAYGGSLGTTSVHINITDVNDYVPQFILSPYFGTAPENTSPGLNGLYILTVKALDFDEGQNGSVKYSIVSGEDNGFRIDPITGVITGIVTFDREEQRFYTLIIQAIDDGIPIQLFSTVEVIVEISDYNDNPPYWPYPYMFARVYENAQIGKIVIKLPANDPDNGVNSSITFTIVGGNSMNKFTLDGNTGEIKVDSSLDYENMQDRIHFIYISIIDNGNPRLEGTNIGELEIHVLDSNDHQPTFINSPLLIPLDEDAPPGALVSVFTATDNDSSVNGEISYSIVQGNELETFIITKHSNGSGLLYLDIILNYEDVSVYHLTIQAHDNGYPIESSGVVVTVLINDVNDEVPVFSESTYHGFVSENNPSAVSVLQVLAIDHDSDTIPGGLIDHYQLLNDTNNEFTLDETNNWIIAPASLDRETISQYTLIVLAIDNDPINPHTGTATVIITILDENDNPSLNGGTREIVILAHNGIFTGRELDVPYFNDPDDNDTFVDCVIQSGDDHLFMVDFNNCSISILDETLLQPGNTFSIIIQGNDGLHSPVTATVYISVTIVSVANPSLLLTTSIAATPEQFLQTIYPSIHTQISSVTGITMNIFSVNILDDDEEHVVIALTTNSTLTNAIQLLFVGKESLPFHLYSLPVDPCVNEPCLNNGECLTAIIIPTEYQSNKMLSQQLILFSPVVSIGYQCNCIPGTAGKICEINYDDCYSNPCLHEATCTDGYQEYVCECPSGTSGQDCSINPDECVTDSNSCQNGGICSNGLNDLLCSCPAGFYGNRCQYAYFEPSSFCDSNPCLNGGTCSPGRDSYSCICTEDFTGDNCERPIQFQGGCVNNPCYNGSTCIETLTGFTCECSVGFTGPLCRFPLNNCELEYCRNGAVCEVGVYGAYLCACEKGYSGDHCTDAVLPCANDPCNNGGTCVNNGTNEFYCECIKDQYGPLCQYHVQPPNFCDNNQLCNSDNSSCSSGQSAFTCVCTNGSGYGGKYCNEELFSFGSCSTNPCFHGGNCSEVSNSVTCSCPIGYTGSTCDIDIDECSSHPCVNGATCLDGFGSYLCQCMDGFSGRHCEVTCPLGHIGENCEIEVDLCLYDPCKNGGSCQTQYGSYTCTCSSKFTGEQCETPNDCSINNCLNGGTCRNDDIDGHHCDCITTENNGRHCELTTVSFTGAMGQSSYRAYDPLGFRVQGTIGLEFATRSTNSLLLLITQYQEGHSLDFMAVEIRDSSLYIMYSLGDQVNGVEVASSSVTVTDGDWHSIIIEINEKVCCIIQPMVID